MNKGDKLGIWARVENYSLTGLEKAILASLLPATDKGPAIRQLSLTIEITKRLIRMTYEINLIEDSVYLKLAEQLQEISKMAAGWRKYINKKNL